MSRGHGTGDMGQENTSSPTSQLSRQRILIIGPSNIGDAILASDVIRALVSTFPSAHVTLVVGARAKALFVEDPRIHSLVDADAFNTLAGRLTLAHALWRYHPHLVVDLRHTLYPILLKPLHAWRYLRQPPRTLRHMRERQVWKLRAQIPSIRIAEAPGDHAGSLWLGAKDRAHIDGLWRRWDLDQTRRLVVICPGARSHIKRWTTEGVAEVADRLIAKDRATVVFSGEPDEEPVIEEIRGLMDQTAHSAVGITTIRQAAALMQRAQLVITNDSASLHLASALRIPTIAIFGPTDETKYGPTAPQQRVIRRRLFCTPCEQALCRFNHECMRFISANEVYQAAVELLGQGAGDGGRGKRKGLIR